MLEDKHSTEHVLADELYEKVYIAADEHDIVALAHTITDQTPDRFHGDDDPLRKPVGNLFVFVLAYMKAEYDRTGRTPESLVDLIVAASGREKNPTLDMGLTLQLWHADENRGEFEDLALHYWKQHRLQTLARRNLVIESATWRLEKYLDPGKLDRELAWYTRSW